MSDCIFCSIDRSRVVAENHLAYAIQDGFPVTEGHTLIIPKRHVTDYFGLSQEELLACNDLLNTMKQLHQNHDTSIAGFNIGMNTGDAAGQTIFHCDIHLIPRRIGDGENPKGGIRHLIPGKGTY